MFVFLMLALLTASAQQDYFPKGVFSDFPQADSGRAKWYSSQLAALKEPSLLEKSGNATSESYRFVWLRTFHHPIAIRLDIRPDGIAEMTVRVTDGEGGYQPGNLIQNRTRPLTREQTQGFLARVERAKFWNLPAEETSDTVGVDGARWIIEGVKGGKYHVVDRWSPGKGPIRELGLLLAIGFADLKIPKDELY